MIGAGIFVQTVALQEAIAKRLNRTVALLLTVIPATQLDPFVPPTPTLTPTPTPTATPVTRRTVVSTNGRGLRVHLAPARPTFTNWRDGTQLTLISGPVTAGGIEWLHMRDANGLTGWVAANYIELE